MKELSKEDQERIEAAGINLIPTFTIYGNLKADIGSSQRSYAQCELTAFIKGAKYEHPIARKEGFNEALEEVGKILMDGSVAAIEYKTWLFDRIQTIKK